MRSLVDIRIRRNSHNEHITHRFRFYQVTNVADMAEIKDTVTKNDCLPVRPHILETRGKLLQIKNFRIFSTLCSECTHAAVYWFCRVRRTNPELRWQ